MASLGRMRAVWRARPGDGQWYEKQGCDMQDWTIHGVSGVFVLVSAHGNGDAEHYVDLN